MIQHEDSDDDDCEGYCEYYDIVKSCCIIRFS